MKMGMSNPCELSGGILNVPYALGVSGRLLHMHQEATVADSEMCNLEPRSIARGGHSMSCFISRKKDKITAVFTRVGLDASEEDFISTFILMYPKDWVRINEKWLEEESNTPPGKKHPPAASRCVHERDV